MKVAYLSPLPPERSGIADYSALLLPALQRRLDLTIVKRGARRIPRDTDLAVYHIGNNPVAHGWIVDLLRQQPGLVVLHDFVLHHLVAGMTVGRGDGDAYLDALQRDAGVVGRLLGHGVIDGLLPPLWESRAEDFPLVGEVLSHARGVVVHSHYVEERVLQTGYRGLVRRIPMPAWPPLEIEPQPLPQGATPVVACLGHLNASKRIPQLLEAFARLRSSFPQALLVLAGRSAEGLELATRLERLGLRAGTEVLHLDYLPEEQLWAVLAACDICVGLRSPTMGETSGIAIRALSFGRPLVVSDVGWFAELPDDVAAKVTVDDWEIDGLAVVLGRLAADADLRRRMGEAAAAYAQSEHGLEHVADLYEAAIEETAGAKLVRSEALGEVARAASEVGFEVDNSVLSEIAASAAELGLGD